MFHSFRRTFRKANTYNLFQRFSTSSEQQQKIGPDFLGIAFFGSLCLLTAGLGTWQSQRYFWKVDLIEQIKKRILEDPVEFSANSTDQLFNDLSSFEGRRLKLEGTFDHSKEVLLGPRIPPAGQFGPAAQGLASNPQGYFVYTPFILKSGKVIFVNRGWVPRTAKEWNRPKGEIKLTILLAKPEEKATFTPPNNISSKILLWLDVPALLMAAGYSLDAQSQFVLADHVVTPNERTQETPFPKDISIAHEQHVMPITHLTYAVTWYSLCLAGIYMTYLKFKPSRPRYRR